MKIKIWVYECVRMKWHGSKVDEGNGESRMTKEGKLKRIFKWKAKDCRKKGKKKDKGKGQGRIGHIMRWEKSHEAPLVWGPLRQSGAPQHHDLLFISIMTLLHKPFLVICNLWF
jgi:hypothetical protein